MHDHAMHDHATHEQELSVLQVQNEGHSPRAMVFAGPARPISLAAAKRTRFVQNLKHNYQRLKEALDFVEHFAVVCELSEGRIAAIRQSKDEALAELSQKFEQKMNCYDHRIQEGAP
jgi:hypothetical protein